MMMLPVFRAQLALM